MSKNKKEEPDLEAANNNNSNKPKSLISVKGVQTFFSRRCKMCLLQSKPYQNTKNINLYNNTDFFKSITHLEQKHPDKYFVETADFQVDLTVPTENYYIIRHWNNIYFVTFNIADELSVTVHRLNTNHYSSRHDRFAIEFTNNIITLVKYGNISQKKSFSENTTVETSIEGLKSVLYDLKNINISITIEYYAVCNECHEIIRFSEGKYIIKSGWFCLACAKFTRPCTYNYIECDFKDTEEKHKKHSLFFCFYRSLCYICRQPIRNENGGPGPIAHYRDKHQNITYLTEVSMRVCKTIGEYCIVEYSDQPMVCRYSLDDTEFRFAVRTPWQHEELKQYDCCLTLIPIVQGTIRRKRTKMFRMQKFLDEFDDWLLVLDKSAFKTWPAEFDVSVDFERIVDSDGDSS